MNQRQLASVLFAVLGVYVAISWLPQIILGIGVIAQLKAMSPRTTDGDNAIGQSLAVVGSAIIAVLLGIILVRMRVRLAERLFPLETEPLVARDLQAVALSVLGVYFVIESICRLVRMAEIEWSAVVQFVLGLGLFLGARAVARFSSAGGSGGSPSASGRAV